MSGQWHTVTSGRKKGMGAAAIAAPFNKYPGKKTYANIAKKSSSNNQIVPTEKQKENAIEALNKGCDVTKEDCDSRTIEVSIKQMIQDCCPFAKKVRQTLQHYEKEVGQHVIDLDCLANTLQQRGYTIKQVTNYGGGVDLWNRLEHSFLTVAGDDPKSPTVIVDSNFQNQFHIAQPSQRYKQVLAILPQVFVGTHQKLNEVVCAVVQEMQTSFKEQDRSVPPWRSLISLQSKWRITRTNLTNIKEYFIKSKNFGAGVNSSSTVNKTQSSNNNNSSSSNNCFVEEGSDRLEIQIQSIDSFSGTSVCSELSALLRENSKSSISEQAQDLKNNQNYEKHNLNFQVENLDLVFQQ